MSNIMAAMRADPQVESRMVGGAPIVRVMGMKQTQEIFLE
jgi:hypothetical protein